MADMSNFFGLGNHKSTVAEGYDTKEREIIRLGDVKEPMRIYGFIISKEGKTKKGKILPRKVLLCGETAMVSLPERYTELYENFNEEQLALITSGRVFLTDITPISTKNGDTFVFKLQTRDD